MSVIVEKKIKYQLNKMLKNRVIYCHAGDLAMLLSLAETSLGAPKIPQTSL